MTAVGERTEWALAWPRGGRLVVLEGMATTDRAQAEEWLAHSREREPHIGYRLVRREKVEWMKAEGDDLDPDLIRLMGYEVWRAVSALRDAQATLKAMGSHARLEEVRVALRAAEVALRDAQDQVATIEERLRAGEGL